MIAAPLAHHAAEAEATDAEPSLLDLAAMPADVRAAAVATIRRLADDIESGRLNGGRIEWREGLAHVVRVELDGTPRVVATDDGGTRIVRQVRLETIDLLTGAVKATEIME